MNTIIHWLEQSFGSLPLPLLEVWGRLAFILGAILAVAAFGGFTFRPGGRWGLGRERQAWDAKAILSIPVTFIAIIITGYLGSFVVLVPGAQTLESLKDLVVFLCVVLFGYPALLTVPFAYGLSDLIEGIPPSFLVDWLPGYFINPACFWMAYQLFGRNPDFRRAATWGSYLLFVLAFFAVEPVLWGYVCSGKFSATVSYRNISSALFFTTGLTWILAPFAMLLALPVARRTGMFWAEIPGHVKERLLGEKTWLWEASDGNTRVPPTSLHEGWPIRMALLAPFIALVLLMTGVTAYVALRSAERDANKLALRLHEEIADNINLRLVEHLSRRPQGEKESAGISAMLKNLPLAQHGMALILDGAGQTIAASVETGDAVAQKAIAAFLRQKNNHAPTASRFALRFDQVTEHPLNITTWMAQATVFFDPRWNLHWTVLTVMPESYYLAGIKTGNSRSAMVFAVALLLSVAVAAFLASVMTARLRSIALATQSLSRGELSQRMPSSRLEELDALTHAFNDMAEQLSRSIGHLRDEVETRKRREQALEESETRVQLAVRGAKLAIWDWDVHSDRLLWDESMYQLYGRDKDQFDGTYDEWSKCLLPEDFARATGDVQAALRGEREFYSEFRVQKKDGTQRVICGVAQTLRDAEGRPVRMVGINWDVTDRRRQELLSAAEARILRMITAEAPQAEILSEIVSAVEALSPGTIGSILLLAPGGQHLRRGAAPGLPEAYNRAVEEGPIGPRAGSCGTAAHRGEPVIVTDIESDPLWQDYRELAREHQLRACWSTPIKDARGAVLGTFAMYYRQPRGPNSDELSLIQRATHLAGVALMRQLAQEQNRKLMHALGERVKELTCLHRTAGILQNFRQSPADWLREIVSIMPAGWQYPEDTAARIRLGELTLSSPGFVETPHQQLAEFTTAAGQKGSVEVVYLKEKPVELEGPFLGEERKLINSLAEMLRSAIDGKNAEDARRENERHLREEKQFIDMLMSSLPGVVFLFDAKGTFLKWNQALAKVSGHADAEIARLSPFDFVDADHQQAMASAIKTVLSRGRDALEIALLTADRSTVPYYLNAVRLHTEQGPCVLGVGIDISDRRRLEEQFRQAQKMEAVGMLAGGVAHDFNNLLTVILGYSELVKDSLGRTDTRRADMEQIIATSRQASSLTGRLLSFSRKQILKPVNFDLNYNLRETQKMLQRIIGEDVVLETQLHSEPMYCKADPGQVEQALINLVMNARDAMPRGGNLVLKTRPVIIDEDDSRRNPQARPGHYVEVAVTDSGIGMTPEIIARVFEPFFTTKGAGKGTGLGLAMVYSTVEQSGGHVEVESTVGRGSTFKLYFPRSLDEATANGGDALHEPIARGDETVLVVEDDEALRNLAARTLNAAGYQVLTAKNGSEALQHMTTSVNPVKLAILDVVMPEMSGPALLSLLHKSNPRLPVLFVSGHTDDTVLRHSLLNQEIDILPKPYTQNVLLRKTREILDTQK